MTFYTINSKAVVTLSEKMKKIRKKEKGCVVRDDRGWLHNVEGIKVIKTAMVLYVQASMAQHSRWHPVQINPANSRWYRDGLWW